VFFCLCAGTLFITTNAFVDAQVTPKWFCFAFCLPALALAYAIVFRKAELSKQFLLWLCASIAVACTAQAVYGVLQYIGICRAFGGFAVTGSFDNPAGFAASLCAGFPFLFVFIFDSRKWLKILSIAAACVICLAVIFSASRAGMLSLLLVVVLPLFYKWQAAKKYKIIVVSVALLVALSGLYFLKKESADGRLLIWRCSWEMIKDKPLLGHGHGGFKANYMDYQAAYFEKHPDSRFVLLADNVSRPFNEYLQILTGYGFAGLAVLLIFVGLIIKSVRKHQDESLFVRIASWCLLSVAVFSFFSYPLRYPFVWVMILFSVFVIFSQNACRQDKPWKATIAICLIVLTIPVVCVKTYKRMSAEIRWGSIANKSLLGQTEKMLPEDNELYAKLYKNELFLYNYTAELNVAKRYEESIKTGKDCEKYWADYDLQMLMADNYCQIQQYAEAEQYYIKASRMCPVRFMPLYILSEIYRDTGQQDKLQNMARCIIDKPVKIASPTVFSIKTKMKKLLEEDAKLNDGNLHIESNESLHKSASGSCIR
jgi:O-antigen ligase